MDIAFANASLFKDNIDDINKNDTDTYWYKLLINIRYYPKYTSKLFPLWRYDLKINELSYI